jgi:hypothetical protein
MMDLVRLMLCTQTSFMVKRIHDKKYAKAFEDTMLSIIKVSSDFSDLKDFSNEFKLIKASLSTSKPGLIASMFDEKHKYIDLALDLTDDIINSIDLRFVEGGSKAFLGLFEVKGEIC